MSNSLTAGLPPTHPGELLREDIIPALGKPKSNIASALKISRQTLHDLLAEKQPVTPKMALRLSKLLGNSPEMWLRMQAAYDLATIAPQIEHELADIPMMVAA